MHVAAEFVVLDDAERRHQHAFLIGFRRLGAEQAADIDLVRADADPGIGPPS